MAGGGGAAGVGNDVGKDLAQRLTLHVLPGSINARPGETLSASSRGVSPRPWSFIFLRCMYGSVLPG